MYKYQQEFIGRGAIKNLEQVLLVARVNKIFLVTGKASYAQCGAKEAIIPLLEQYRTTIFMEYTANPTFEQALKGAELFRSVGAEIIIAIGGGSAIDIAKVINALQAHTGVEKPIACGEVGIKNPLAPLICIPTTAGTGSEATHFAVNYIDGTKHSVASQQLLPDVVILDPQFTDNLPSFISACTGFDALSQAIESYWSREATPQSKTFASRAIKLIIRYLPTAINARSTLARDILLKAANLAGKAINISKTTAPHALSYTITSNLGLPHGHAVALMLGRFFELHEHIIQDKNEIEMKRLRNLTDELYSLFGVTNSSDATAWWYSLMEECRLETNFNKVGISHDKNVEDIINGVNIERLDNHPIKLTKANLQHIFKPVS